MFSNHSTKSVVVNLIGGLGNQMFQYAVGRSVAQTHGVPLLLDTRGFDAYPLRHFELGNFNINARVASQTELDAFNPAHPGKMGFLPKLLKRLGIGQSEWVLREASFTYDARVQTVTPPVYLDGYWQSERYFSHIADSLRSEFTLKEEFDPANLDMARQIAAAGSGAVSLHIRRGDYVTNAHTAQYHGVCPLEYYHAAVAYIAGQVENPHLFVFSDDHGWVREQFNVGYPMTLVQINDPHRGVNDMMLMKSCQHHIIANSSFSWWGAWLNPSAEKIVVAPARWFGAADHDTRDLIPDGWVRL